LARELQPASRSILADQGLLLFYQGKREQAVEQLRQIETAEPAFRSAHMYLSYIYFVSRDWLNSLSESRKAAESSHDPVELAIVSEAEKGFAAGGSQDMLDRLLKAQQNFSDQGRYPLFHVAETLASLGRKREALDYLDASYKKRESLMVILPVDQMLSSLRHEPAYEALCARLAGDVRN
jgi:tetratricopeptide (TPR) repeat protein